MACVLNLLRFQRCAGRLKHTAIVRVALCSVLSAAANAQVTKVDVVLPPQPPTVAQAAPEAMRAIRVVLLLPIENALLKRAATTVRDGANAVFATRKSEANVSECAYGSEGVAAAYAR